MVNNLPLYLTYICSSCIALRKFKRKDDDSNIYSCHVCGLEISYNNGAISVVGMPPKGSGRPLTGPICKGMIRNHYYKNRRQGSKL